MGIRRPIEYVLDWQHPCGMNRSQPEPKPLIWL